MDKYIINTETLLVIGDINYSKVIEKQQILNINKLSTSLINDSCCYYGSSYKGRVEGTKNMIGVSYKAPIIISETKEIVFFPTCCTRNSNCIWISLNNINKYYTLNNGYTEIIFNNMYKIQINISIGVIEKQILRSTRLLSVLNSRKKS